MKKYCYISNTEVDITFHHLFAERNIQYTLKRMSQKNTDNSPIICQNEWKFIHLILDSNQLVHIQV